MSFGYYDKDWVDPPKPPHSCADCAHWVITHTRRHKAADGFVWHEDFGICDCALADDLGVECDPLEAIEWTGEHEGEPQEPCRDWSAS